TIDLECNDPDRPLAAVPLLLKVGTQDGVVRLELDHGGSPGGRVTARITGPFPCGTAPVDRLSIAAADSIGLPAPLSLVSEGCGWRAEFGRAAFLSTLPRGARIPIRITGRQRGLAWFTASDTVAALGPV